MNKTYNTITSLVLVVFMISCETTGPKRPAEAEIVFGILDEENPWMTTEIVQDSIPYQLLNNTR